MVESPIEVHKILVPVDYSQCSDLACRYALKIARVASAEIKFFHAFYSPAYDLIELTGNKATQKKLREDVTERLMVSEKKDMADFLDRMRKFPEYSSTHPVQTSWEIRPGLAREEIPKITEEFKPQLVIMGTRGLDKKENSVLGSITASAIRKLKVPLLAIPEQYTFIGEENLNRIAYLTDFDETDFGSIKKLMGFTSLLGLTIWCVHIGSKGGEWEKVRMDGLKDYFQKNYNTSQVECRLLSPGENMLHSIDDFVKSEKINILSLTTRRRSIIDKLFRPNLTKRLFYHSNIPLLIFHH